MDQNRFANWSLVYMKLFMIRSIVLMRPLNEGGDFLKGQRGGKE